MFGLSTFPQTGVQSSAKGARRGRRSGRRERLRSRARFRPQVGLLEQRALLSNLQVNINPYVNSNLRSYTNGLDYPIGGTSLTVGGVAFTLANYPGGGTGVIQTPNQSSPSSFDVSVNIVNPTTVYTLINSTFGVYGDTVGAVEFKATGGLDYMVNLVEGQDIRDHNNDDFNNTIGQGALGGIYLGTASFGGGQVRLDEQGFTLPSSFQSSTLTDIILHGYGNYLDGQPFLAAATVTNSPTTTTLTSSANPSVFGQTVTFTATVAAVSPGSGTPTGTVNFLDNGTTIGADEMLTAGVATFSTSDLAVGTHLITARYFPFLTSGFFGSTSAVLDQVVVNPFIVTNTNDSGIGSLRQAILNADQEAGHTISFAIPGAGVHTIAPTSALPTITDPVTIDGYTQGAKQNSLANGDNAVLLIELNGASAPAGSNGLSINAWGSTVEGLVINRFGGAGIAITGSGASNNAVLGNFIGTNAAGTAALGNGTGVLIDNGASNNTIGGPTDNDRNVISGNGGASQGVGVYLDGTTTQSNSIIGNFIGTKAAGTAGISASSAGVLINNSPDNTIGGTTAADRNIISGNSVVGVYIALAGATGNAVQNNYIGTDVHGLAGIPNGVDGIYINDAPNNTIGGTAAGAGNLISANLSAGIQIYGAGATNNQIFRNRIGLDANGRLTLPNKVTGIFSQISIKANDFGFSTVNQNLGQVLPWQSPSSIGGVISLFFIN